MVFAVESYVDAVYDLSRLLPEREKYNLANQIERASTSILPHLFSPVLRLFFMDKGMVKWELA